MIYKSVFQGVFLHRPPTAFWPMCSSTAGKWWHMCKNTSRCGELLIPRRGGLVYLPRRPKAKNSVVPDYRPQGDTLFNIDSQVPNRLAGEWMAAGRPGVTVEQQKAEHRYGDARLDWFFQADGETLLLEVKGVTLEQNGVARFPDAPTERGAKHVHHLRQAVGEGYGAYILFVCQMAGISRVEPNVERDPAFAQATVDGRGSGRTAVGSGMRGDARFHHRRPAGAGGCCPISAAIYKFRWQWRRSPRFPAFRPGHWRAGRNPR